MKNKSLAILPSFCFLLLLTTAAFAKDKPGYYQVTAYHYSTSDQEASIDLFLKDAFLPSMHKKGINNIGVFKPITNDTAADKRIYVIRTFKDIKQLSEVDNQFWDVSIYGGAGESYVKANYKKPAYSRIENIIIYAFDLAPKMTMPALSSPKSDHIYELRSYESPSELLHNSKVKMFNQGGEIALFNRLGFNAVFYGKVIAGCRMPNLMYMTSFENRKEREDHWKAFSADPAWKTLSAMPEYQNNVSRNETILMKAADYSDY